MKVYVLTSEPYHDNSTILGVYLSREAAEAAQPGKWARSHWSEDRWEMRKSQPFVAGQLRGSEEEDYQIREIELSAAGADPIQAFALAVLAGDPVAVDAVRDILRS